MTTKDTGTEKPAAGATSAGDLAEELKRLGRQLGDAAKAAWESESSRKAQTQLREGLTEMTRELEEAARKIQVSEETQKLREQTKRVVESAQQSDVAEEMRKGVLTGLRELNAVLARAIDRLQDDEPAQDDSR